MVNFESNKKPYSQSILEYTQLISKSYITVELNPDKYQSNQTVCMGYDFNEEWREDVCLTTIDTNDMLIRCSCNMALIMRIAVITDE